MNLLYSNYLKGSYVGYVDGALVDYSTDGGNSIASYFADLQPNTTYTLTRITSTSRFRVATFYTDVKNSTGQVNSIAQWWYADSYNTITFTTGSADTHLVVYYTNSSQYDAQIMLNEGSEAEPYEAPTQSFTYAPWTGVEGEYPSNGIEPAPPFSPPYPAAMWRIDGAHNNGYPWHELLRGVPVSKGAFQGVASLAAVRIPITVKAIGSAAFAGTALQRVKIAADCAYEETSFPAGCVVEHYDDDRYEQLRDCDGRAILDCDARRLYVRKAENTNG